MYNAELSTGYDVKLNFKADPALSPEEQQKAKEEYFASHYYISAVMISGEDILKAELRQPPLENKKNEPSKSVATSAWYWCLYLFILYMYLPVRSFVTGQKLFSNPICKS